MENEKLNLRDEDDRPAEPAGDEAQIPAAGESAAEGIEPKPKSGLQRVWPWLAAVLASLLVGAGLVFFLLYLPASSALRQTRAELTSATTALDQAESKAEGLQSDLTSATGQLERMQAELETLRLSHAVSKLQANISYARLALVNKDLLTARQELSDADANLAELTLLLDDPDTTSALADRLKTIRASLTSDPSKALEEMRTLGENLARLENR